MLFVFLLLKFLIFQQVLAQKCQNFYGQTKYDGNCKVVSECTGAAFKGNCEDSKTICCVQDANPSQTSNQIITKDAFLKVVGNTTRNNVLYNFFVESMAKAEINNEYKAAAYLSQLAAETKNFEFLESDKNENDNNPDIGNSKQGDGNLYRGRGAIYLRGKSNYERANKIPNLEFNLIENPEKAAFPSIAFKIAAWIWSNSENVKNNNETVYQGSLNNLADGTYLNLSILIYNFNLDLNDLNKRLDLNDKALEAINYRPLKKGRGAICKLGNEVGNIVPVCLANQKSSYCGCEGDFDKENVCPYGLLKNGKCKNPKYLRCCVEKFQNNLDLVIVMDNSGSIGPQNFEVEKNFVKSLIQKLDINRDKTRVSVVEFSNNARIVMYFNQTTNSTNLLNTVGKISHTAGGTNTAEALNLVNKTILQENNGMRGLEEGVPKVILVITDGASNNQKETLEAADAIKKRGYSIITAGVGNVNQYECKKMASTVNDFEYVNNFDSINEILDNIASKSVVQAAPVVSLKPIRTKLGKNQYKYFKYPLNKTLNEFSIELNQLNGLVKLFYSFSVENPKDLADLILIDSSTKTKRQVSGDKRYYTVKVPSDGNYDELYVSAKGYDDSNSFEMKVLNELVQSNANCLKSNFFIISAFILAGIKIF